MEKIYPQSCIIFNSFWQVESANLHAQASSVSFRWQTREPTLQDRHIKNTSSKVVLVKAVLKASIGLNKKV
jgi:hypothetical protein